MVVPKFALNKKQRLSESVPMFNVKLSKKIISVLLALVLLATFGAIVFFQLPQTSNAKVEPEAPGYIADSKIFLLSATASYGYVGGNPFSPSFIVHATIRNDYTSQQPDCQRGQAWFIMYAKIYDKNGNQIQSQPYGPPQKGFSVNSNQQNMSSNETETLTIVMLTSNSNIDHYTLAFGWLSSLPVF